MLLKMCFVDEHRTDTEIAVGAGETCLKTRVFLLLLP